MKALQQSLCPNLGRIIDKLGSPFIGGLRLDQRHSKTASETRLVILSDVAVGSVEEILVFDSVVDLEQLAQ